MTTEIRYEDVRVGDRVRVVVELTVTDAMGNPPVIRPRWFWGHAVESTSIELLSRPVPPAVCGDIREDPQTGARYVRTGTDDPGRRHWIAFTGQDLGRSLYAEGDADIIARLVPVTP